MPETDADYVDERARLLALARDATALIAESANPPQACAYFFEVAEREVAAGDW